MEEMKEITADDGSPLDKKKNVDTSSIKRDFKKETVESVRCDLPEIHFVTGSSYKGTWDSVGMTDIGRYVMPHGVTYEGQFRCGMFHGKGTLKWPQNQRIDGIWKYGKLQECSLTFGDDLAFESSNWKYCEFPDRRFYIRPNIEVQPAGRSLKTRIQPTKLLPPGCYDTGDGVFDPRTYCVTSYENPKKVLRIPKRDERDWIVENCRKASYEPTGYRSDLKEACKEDVSGQKNIPLSKESPDDWWQRMTTFKRDMEESGDLEKLEGRSEFGESDDELIRPNTCACCGFGKVGESCYCIYLQDSRSQSFDGEAEEYKDDLHEGRDIFCGEMDEFDEENSWKLLGTVCGPKKSTDTLVKDFEIKSPSGSRWPVEKNISDDKMDEKISNEIETVIPKKKEIAGILKKSKKETIEEKEDSYEKIFDYRNEERYADWQEIEEETISDDKDMEQQDSRNKILTGILKNKVKEENKEVEGGVAIQNEKDINKDEEEEREKEIERKSMLTEFFAIEKEQMEYEEIDKTDTIAEIKEVQQIKEIEKAEESNKAEQSEEIEKAEESNKAEQSEEIEKAQESNKAEQSEEIEKAKESNKAEQSEEIEKAEESNKAEQSEEIEKTQESKKAEQSEEIEKAQESNKAEQSEEIEKAQESNKAEQSEEIEKSKESNKAEQSEEIEKAKESNKTEQSEEIEKAKESSKAEQSEELEKAKESNKTEQSEEIKKAKESNKAEQSEAIEKANESNKTEQIEEIEKAKESNKAEQIEEIEKAKESNKAEQIEEIEKAKESNKAEQIEEIEKAKESNKAEQIEEIEKAKESNKAEQIEEIEQTEDNGEIREASKVMETEESTGGYRTSIDKKEESLKSESEFSSQPKEEVTPIAALEKQQNKDVRLKEKVKEDNKMEKAVEVHDKKFFESEQLIFQDELQHEEKLKVEEKKSVELEQEKLQQRMSFLKETIPRGNEEIIVPDFRSPRCNVEYVRKPCDADVCIKKSFESKHPSKKCRAGRLPVNLPARRQELQKDKNTN